MHPGVETTRNGGRIEIDLLVVNEGLLVAVACKSKLTQEPIDEHLEQMAKLIQLLPSYQHHRMLGGWVKGIIQEAIEAASRRRGASVNVVNAAYTSQWLPDCSAFGKRIGEFIYCPLGRGLFAADHIAAVNIFHRKNDTGISRYLFYREVKKVLEERSRQTERPCLLSGECAVERSCLRLPRRDSSCSGNTINGERIIFNLGT